MYQYKHTNSTTKLRLYAETVLKYHLMHIRCDYYITRLCTLVGTIKGVFNTIALV